MIPDQIGHHLWSPVPINHKYNKIWEKTLKGLTFCQVKVTIELSWRSTRKGTHSRVTVLLVTDYTSDVYCPITPGIMCKQANKYKIGPADNHSDLRMLL